MNQKSIFMDGLSWAFGIAVFANGILNLLRGNDPLLGVAFLAVSFIYFSTVTTFFSRILGITIPPLIRIILALAILWISLAVGAIPEGYYPEIIR